MTRTQITNCVDCPYAYLLDKIRIWERYNWTTQETEETRTFTWNNTDDLKDISEIHELALEWLQDPENLCNQDGEWTETGYVYFRGGQTIEIRETYYGHGVTCTIDENPKHPYDDAKYCDVAADENRIPTYSSVQNQKRIWRYHHHRACGIKMTTRRKQVTLKIYEDTLPRLHQYKHELGAITGKNISIDAAIQDLLDIATSKRYYCAYDTNPIIIYGIGHTEDQTMRDAIRELGPQGDLDHIRIAECTAEVYTYVLANGGNAYPGHIFDLDKSGVMTLGSRS